MKIRARWFTFLLTFLSACQGVIELGDGGQLPDGYQQADQVAADDDTEADGAVPHDNFSDDGRTDTGSDPCAGITCSGHGTCVVNSGVASCICESGYHPEGLQCIKDDPCAGVTCSGHGVCRLDAGGRAYCVCDSGYHPDGLFCLKDDDPCAGVTCSSHGTCVVQSDGPVCVCDEDFSPGDASGLTCLPTSQVCVGGPINLDVDEDSTVDTWFEPNEWECWMYELVNRTRASHDDEGSPECHKPLLWSVEWSAHGRNHSLKMKLRGSLFHEDYPWGQNCAYGCDPPCEMDMYMTGPNEGHCPPLSHHCNIMRCGFSNIGIGYVDTWNTQNFY